MSHQNRLGKCDTKLELLLCNSSCIIINKQALISMCMKCTVYVLKHNYFIYGILKKLFENNTVLQTTHGTAVFL